MPEGERGPGGWRVAAALAAVLGAVRHVELGPYPPGVDPGSWLMLGKLLFGEGNDACGYPAHVFPPLVPSLMHVGAHTVGPLAAARLGAAASVALVAIAVYAVARQGLRTGGALLAALLVASSFPVAERSLTGGFPQNMGFAFALLAASAAARFVLTGAREAALRQAAWLVAVALTHHATFVVALAVIATAGAVGWIAWPAVTARRLATCAAWTVPGALAFLPTALALAAAGYDPPLNAAGHDVARALHHGFREGIPFWSGLLGAGLVAVAASARPSPTWIVAVATGSVGLSGLLATSEPRLLPWLVLGSTVGLGLGLAALRPRLARPARLAVDGTVALFALALLGTAEAASRAERTSGRVLDGSYVAAARWVDGHAPSGLVAVNASAAGHPVGLWFSGLTRARVLVGSDPQWLAFPRQRASAALVADLFRDGRPLVDAARAARAAGIDLLVTRKRDRPEWAAWAESARGRVAYEDAQFVAFTTEPADSP